MTAMARELVEKGGVGESADAVWKDLERERAKHTPAPTSGAEVIVLPVTPIVERPSIAPEEDGIQPEPDEAPALVGPQLVYPSTKPRPKRKVAPLWPTDQIVGEQMRLFG